MARKPKTTRTTKAFATGADPGRPALNEAPVATRRGRPSKTAQAASQVTAAENSDDLAIGIADTGVRNTDASDEPNKGRQGRKPRAPASVTAAALLRNEPRRAKGSQDRKLDDAEDAAEAEDAALIAEAVEAGGLVVGSESLDRGSDESNAADKPAPSPAALNTAASPRPAAQWDRATDTVRFDWPEIEQTAAQEGANQVMAKLLIAARDEGTNSRWPL